MNSIQNTRSRNHKPPAHREEKNAKESKSPQKRAPKPKRAPGAARLNETKGKGTQAQKAMGMGTLLSAPLPTLVTSGAGMVPILGEGQRVYEGVDALGKWFDGQSGPAGGQSSVRHAENRAVKNLSASGGNPPNHSAGSSNVEFLATDGHPIDIEALYEKFRPQARSGPLNIKEFTSKLDSEMKNWGTHPKLQRQGKDVGFIHPFAVSDVLFDVAHGRMTPAQFKEMFTKEEYWHKVAMVLPSRGAFTSLGAWLLGFERFAQEEQEDIDTTLGGYLEMIPQKAGRAYLDDDTNFLGEFSLEGMIAGAREYYRNPAWTLFNVENRMLDEIGILRGDFATSYYNPPLSRWGALNVP